jgi:hypothetical protein
MSSKLMCMSTFLKLFFVEKYYFLWYNAFSSAESQPTFRKIMSAPSSESKNKPSQKVELCLPPAFTLSSCSAYSPIVKMEATFSSETSVDIQRTTRRYIPEDRILHNHRCKNFKSYIFLLDMKIYWVQEFHLVFSFLFSPTRDCK